MQQGVFRQDAKACAERIYNNNKSLPNLIVKPIKGLDREAWLDEFRCRDTGVYSSIIDMLHALSEEERLAFERDLKNYVDNK